MNLTANKIFLFLLLLLIPTSVFAQSSPTPRPFDGNKCVTFLRAEISNGTINTDSLFSKFSQPIITYLEDPADNKYPPQFLTGRWGQSCRLDEIFTEENFEDPPNGQIDALLRGEIYGACWSAASGIYAEEINNQYYDAGRLSDLRDACEDDWVNVIGASQQSTAVDIVFFQDYFIPQFQTFAQTRFDVDEGAIPTPTAVVVSTITPELNIKQQTEIVKCGLQEGGYRCCMPNVESGSIQPEGSFFELMEGLWDSISNFILSNIGSRAGIGKDELNDAVFDGGLQLCPRAEEGPRGERFVNLENSSIWVDQDGQYDGRGDNGEFDQEEISAYEELLFGDGTADRKGIFGVIRETTTLSSAIEYEGNTYGCFCVNTEEERNKIPDDYISLPENADLLARASIAQTKADTSAGEPVVLAWIDDKIADIQETIDERVDQGKLCKNLGVDEKIKCKRCVLGYDVDDPTIRVTELGGAWTAVGCIYSDFSQTLEKQLFPLFIMIGGLVSLGCIIYGAFMMQISMGNPEKVSNAQSLMTSCITGLILIIFSVFILRVIGIDILRLPGLAAPSPTPSPSVTVAPSPTP